MKEMSGIERIDVNEKKRVMRIIGSVPFKDMEACALRHGVQITRVEQSQESKTVRLSIDGMTCSSCEVIIEKKFKNIPGVKHVSVSAHKGTAHVECDCADLPSLQAFQDVLGNERYRVREIEQAFRSVAPVEKTERPSFARVLGFFVLAFLASTLLSRFGIFQTSSSVGEGMTIGSAFILGLIAATSSCLATVGGLLLSAVADGAKQQVQSSFIGRAFPTLMFIAGRLVSYLLLGGLIGYLGAALSPSPLVTGGLILLAAAYMIVMGLDMLGIAPAWLKALLPKMPKALAHRALSASEGSHAFAPALMGAATFFVPCGFTQALQLYALTLGNPVQSALLLGVFALGTSPMLLALGFSFNLVKGQTKRFVFHFAGSLIILMGIANIQNGFTITGHPLSWPSLPETRGDANAGELSPIEGGVQVMRMSVGPGGYTPNEFTVRAGVPTKWVINGSAGAGCAMALSAPQLGIRKLLTLGENTVEFTAPQSGTYSFSCSMGMYRGAIRVVANS